MRATHVTSAARRRSGGAEILDEVGLVARARPGQPHRTCSIQRSIVLGGARRGSRLAPRADPPISMKACCCAPTHRPGGLALEPAVLAASTQTRRARRLIAANALSWAALTTRAPRRISSAAASRPQMWPVVELLAGLDQLVDVEEARDLRANDSERSVRSLMLSQRGSSGGTQMILRVLARFVEYMTSTPTGLDRTQQPGTSDLRAARARRADRRPRRACRG
mgnify:CR=1 FL=1